MTDTPFSTDEAKTAETARLNDLARTDWSKANATWVITAGILEMIRSRGVNAKDELIDVVGTYSVFDPGGAMASAISGCSISGGNIATGKSTTSTPTARSIRR